MIELKEKNDEMPVCPLWSESILEVWFRELKSMFGKR